MSKNTVEKIKEQAAQPESEPKKPGFFRRAWSWVKGIFTRGAKAVGGLVPDRAKQFVVSIARNVGNALSYGLDYVKQPVSRIANIIALAATVIWLGLAVAFLPLVFLAIVGAGTLLFVVYAYLNGAKESRVARGILSAADAVLTVAWIAFKWLTFASLFAGHWAVSTAFALLVGLYVVLSNQAGQNDRLEHRKAVAEAQEILSGPSMPAVAVS